MVDRFLLSGLFLAFEPEVGSILIGENGRLFRCAFGNDRLESFFRGIGVDLQRDPSCFPTDHAHD